MVVSGIRNTTSQLGQLIAKDFSGSKNFFYWLGAIIIVGSVGYIPKAQTPSRAFLILIMVVMVISDKGFFAQFANALSSVQNQSPSSSTNVGSAQSDPNSSSSNKGSVNTPQSTDNSNNGLFGLPTTIGGALDSALRNF